MIAFTQKKRDASKIRWKWEVNLCNLVVYGCFIFDVHGQLVTEMETLDLKHNRIIFELWIHFIKYSLILFFYLFIADVFVKLDTRERIVNQSIFHVHHHHAKMVARVDKTVTIPTNASAHQVSKHTFNHNIKFNFINVKTFSIRNVVWRKLIIKFEKKIN